LIGPDELDRRATELADEFGEPVAAGAAVLGERLRRGIPSDAHGWTLRHKDGSPMPTRLSVGALRDRQSQLTGLLAIEPAPFASEVDTLPPLLHHDALTGLPTRSVLSDRAEMAIQRAARQHSVVALLVLEIANFQALSDEHGRSVCDDLLRATASRLHFELRKTDTAVRLDGGQFTAMLVDLHTAEEARLIADKVRQALSARINVGVAILPLTVRVGVAWFPSHGNQLLPLLEAAEVAMEAVPERKGGVACAPLPSPVTA
jgi:diguanylate cyclase (GGDEF)-like protein